MPVRIRIGKAKRERQPTLIEVLIKAFFAFFWILLFNHFWPDVIGFKTFELWSIKVSASTWIRYCIPLFIWGIVIQGIHMLFIKHDAQTKRNAEGILIVGFIKSVFHGVTEEISFRWLLLFLAIIGAKIGNYLFFGWLGFGIGEFLQIHLTGPIANFFTAGYLKPFVDNPSIWAVGAALLSTNAFFRDGHKYQGWIGYTNSWFAGMYFFYLALNFGLPVAIFAHFGYNFIVYSIYYLDAAYERARG